MNNLICIRHKVGNLTFANSCPYKHPRKKLLEAVGVAPIIGQKCYWLIYKKFGIQCYTSYLLCVLCK